MVCFLMYHVIFFINNISLLLLKKYIIFFLFQRNFFFISFKKKGGNFYFFLRHHKIITDLRWYRIYTMCHKVTQPYTCLCHSEQCLGPKCQSITRCLTVIFASHAQWSQSIEGPMSNCQRLWHNFFPYFLSLGWTEPHNFFSVSLVFYSFFLFGNF